MPRRPCGAVGVPGRAGADAAGTDAPRKRRAHLRGHSAHRPGPGRAPGALPALARRRLPRLDGRRQPAREDALWRDRAAAPRGRRGRRARAADLLPGSDRVGARRQAGQWSHLLEGSLRRRRLPDLLPLPEGRSAPAHQRGLHPRQPGVGPRRQARRLLRQRPRHAQLRRLRGGRDLERGAAAAGRRQAGHLVPARLVGR